MRGSGKKASGPEFVRFFGPLLDTLRELGDSGRPKEVTEHLASREKISDEELNRTLKNGSSRFANQVAWARLYLAKAGLIDTSQRGVWTLTETGHRARLDHEEALRMFHNVQRTFRENGPGESPHAASDEEAAPPDEQAPAEEDFREKMARMLQLLSPQGFERLCRKSFAKSGSRRSLSRVEPATAASTALVLSRSTGLCPIAWCSNASGTPNKSPHPISANSGQHGCPGRSWNLSRDGSV